MIHVQPLFKAKNTFINRMKNKTQKYHTVGTIKKKLEKTKKYHTVGTIKKKLEKTKKYHTVGTIKKTRKNKKIPYCRNN
jgi:hypothetical protein